MSKLSALLLSLALLFSTAISFTSCSYPAPDDELTEDKTPDDSGNTPDTIVVPELKEYPELRTVKFDEIVYARPDMESIGAAFAAVAEAIASGDGTFEGHIAAIEALETDYESVYAMYAYTRIQTSHNAADEYWQGEYSYISENFPTFTAAIEKLFVAAAQSADAKRYEDEYFGEGLIEEYAGGGDMTDELVLLLERESELENKYSAISTANVVITYKNMTDTYDNIIAFYEDHYGDCSMSCKNAVAACDKLYKKESARITRECFMELLRVRRQIADSLHLDSYADYAYDNLYHDYDRADMVKYLTDIARYIVPVYSVLDSYVFRTYFDSVEAPALDRVSLINGLYGVYAYADGELSDIYSYMLQFELYDIESTSENRFDGAFTTYVDSYDSPFLFVTAGGTADDYTALSHEFGHFADAFINGGSSTSLDLSEVSSTALEYLTFLEMSKTLDEDTVKYLHYTLTSNALNTFIFQGFYALFEHYVYDLRIDEINDRTVTNAIKRAATDIGLNADALVPNEELGIYHALDYVLIPHLIQYPFYVESYCTSVAVALEIYFTESEEEGAGLSAYKTLIKREDDSLTFEEYLSGAGLSSPFSAKFVEEIAYKIYYDILGDYRFNENTKRSTSVGVLLLI